MIVQGDVFLVRTKRIPIKATKRCREPRGFVIAEGELTGHAHVIKDDVEMYEHNGVLYIKVVDCATVAHEEHRPVVLTEGIWRAGIVREYDNFEPDEVIRLIVD